MVRINYEVPDDLHRRAKSLASWKGQTFKAWVERALAAPVLIVSFGTSTITNPLPLGYGLAGNAE